MTHWAVKELGKEWTKDHDCFYWFRKWSEERFGILLPDSGANHDILIKSSSRIMSSNIAEIFGYIQTNNPKEGDAVFLTQRNRPHHLGMAVFPENQFYVLHALENCGVVASTGTDLALNGWKIKGYWTLCDSKNLGIL